MSSGLRRPAAQGAFLRTSDERGPCLHTNVGKVLQHLVQVLEDASCSAYHLDYHAMLAVRFNLNPLA